MNVKVLKFGYYKNKNTIDNTATLNKPRTMVIH